MLRIEQRHRARRPSRLRSRRVTALCGALAAWGIGASAQAAPVLPLDIKIIYAHNDNREVDPRIATLVKDFGALKFTGYQLKDQTTVRLELEQAGRLRLPSGSWMTLTAFEVSDEKARLELEVKELKFKTTVTLIKGATLAVGGPPYENGALILAVARRL